MKKKKRKIIWFSVICVLAAILISFLGWTSFYYHADATAIAMAKKDATIQRKDNLTILPSENSDTAIIFYPGGKIEDISYLPLLEKIRTETGFTCILVHMPLNLAVFNSNAADQVMQKYPDIENWILAGHSLGGIMASQYASHHPDQCKRLILMGAYLYGSYPAEQTLTIYGSLNTAVKDKITYSENVVCIEGGNHAQFGNYGKQKGDADATISTEAQQNQTAAAISAFLKKAIE